MNIDHESSLPLYHQIKEELLNQIESSILKEDEMIPSELELQAIFKVSRPTVRQAISELIQSGHLYRKRGIGTFVCKPRIERDAQELLGFTEEMQRKGLKTFSIDINLQIGKPSKALASKLLIPEDNLVITIKRLRFVNNEPIGIHTSHI
ncbi:MAG TPA: GntR family transcriptional regulator, partial [Brevefilum sp.]|nr:GntR family transcriptional regulator [Brevefilum sp.]